MKALVVGSFNPAKAAEMAELLRGLELPIRSLRDFPAVQPVPETGETFAGNARQKALGLARQIAGLPAEGAGDGILGVVADDSGLEVDALGGAPGVYSARFAGPGAADEANNRLLLERLGSARDRTARFVCVIALVEGERLLKTFRAEVEGQILDAPRGVRGFGYDPLFYYPAFGCSFGEAAPERKLTVSHRGMALRELWHYLREWRRL